MPARNYKREYKKFHSSKKAKSNRAATGRARTKVGLKKGDPREVDHKKPLSKGGSNKRSNLRVVSKTTNRKKGKKTTRRK
jgi:5-methylcytosine-specific restriction endonuclease McrA